MAEYKTPGVYIEEIPKLPPSIASVETAIPSFIGYTEKAQLKEPGDLLNVPRRISSMLQYEQYFGGPELETSIQVTIDETTPRPDIQAKVLNPSKYLMYYQLQMFFINGGGDCYVVSVGDYSSGGVIDMAALQHGLAQVEKVE
jgi:Phage tail sheath protein FI